MGLGVWWNYEHSAAHPQRGRRPAKIFLCEVLQPKPIAEVDSFVAVGESIFQIPLCPSNCENWNYLL